MRHAWILLLFLAACTQTEPTTILLPLDGRLVLAWEQEQQVFIWQTGVSAPQQIASDGVVQVFVAPDGEHIATTRGANRAPETLWIIAVDGSGERQLVGENLAEDQSGAMQIGDVRWLDGETLYFNTLSPAQPTFLPNDDLYRVAVSTGEITQVLPAGEGGRIHISPDQQHMLLIHPGRYGETEGRIQLYNPQMQDEPRLLLSYPAVATASEFPFYPEVFWLPDSSAALVAIPDSDAIYSEMNVSAASPIRLWRLPLADSEQSTLIGTVLASFFGLPRWSGDASQMLFLRRNEVSGGIALYLADGSGADEQVYLQDASALLGAAPRWIPGAQQFFYADALPSGETMYAIGSRDAQPMRLTMGAMLLPQFVNESYFLALFPTGGNTLELRLVRLDGGSSQAIETIAQLPGTSIPLVDFVWLPGD